MALPTWNVEHAGRPTRIRSSDWRRRSICRQTIEQRFSTLATTLKRSGAAAQTHEPVPAGLAGLAPKTSFVGREPEIAELRRVLADNRLVTFVGAGGVGKTRLALQLTGEL